jgi:hypothetical protein
VAGLARRQLALDSFTTHAEPGSIISTVITSHLAAATVVGRFVTDPNIAWLTCPLAALTVLVLTRGLVARRRVTF